MELIFLGTGSCNPRTNSSAVVKSSDTNFLINCSKDFLEQINREKIDKLDFVIILNDSDKAIEGIPKLKEWMDSKDYNSLNLFTQPHIFKKIKDTFKNVSYLEPKYFDSEHSFTVNNIKITPFKLSQDSIGIRFLDVVFADNFNGELDLYPNTIPHNKLLKNAELLIIGAPNWFGSGKYNLSDSIKLAKELSPKQFVITNIPKNYPEQEEAELKVNQYWTELGSNQTKISLAYDGLRINLREHISQILYEIKEAINLPYPHGYNILSGDKKIIVDSKLSRSKVGKFLYLIEDGKLCYGLIRLKAPTKINLVDFETLAEKHCVTEDEKNKWWPHKEILYAYDFDVIEIYPEPKGVQIKDSDLYNVFLDKFTLSENDLIKDVIKYNPVNVTTDILKDDWRIVCAWYSTKKSGKTVKNSYETIINLAKLIYDESIKRGVIFNPDIIKGYSKELYNKVKSNDVLNIENKDVLDEFESMTLIKDFISIVGSFPEGKEKPNDMNILIRLTNPSEHIKNSIETKILKSVSFADKLHFIWGEPEEPHDTYIPLFDLSIKKIDPLKIIKMHSEEISLGSVSQFESMKPAKKFYQVDELVKFIYNDDQTQVSKYAVEKKFNGLRGVLYKVGDSIKIFSEQKKEVTKYFPSLVAEARNLVTKDIILDGEITVKAGGRADIIKYMVGETPVDDSDIQYHVFDCVYYDADISEEVWHKRKSLLHSLNFGKHIKEANSIIIDSGSSMKQAIEFCKNLSESEGAVVKKYDSIYKKNGESEDWIKFRNENSIIVKIMDVNKEDDNYVYTTGITVENVNEFNKDYITEDNTLLLGDTLVTKEKFDNGDTIILNIEEVWKHKFDDGTIRFSIHKPKVMKAASTKTTSSWTILEDLTNKDEVIENIDESIQGKVWKKKIAEGPKFGKLSEIGKI